jgi:phage FluMu protein Com
MPINFRCPTCDRTLSIARRKAGSEVQCPKCGNQVKVPAKAGVAVPSNPHKNALENMPLFERADFEALLDPGQSVKPLPRVTPPKAPSAPSAFEFDNQPNASPLVKVSAPLPPLPVVLTPKPLPLPENVAESAELEVAEIDGVIVTSTRMIWIAALIAVLLAVSFAVGYFLGRATR